MRWLLSLICLFAGLLTSFALAGRPVIGAAVTITNLDLAHRSATLETVNNSTKDITAYSVAVVATYANGSEDRSEKLFDYGSALTARGEVLHPGDVAEQPAIWGESDGNPLVRVDAKVVAIVYADLTAETSDEEALSRIQSHRSSAALALTKSVEILQHYLADPRSDHPGVAASAEIKRLSKLAEQAGMDKVYLQGVSEKLEEALQTAAKSNVSERAPVGQYLIELEQRAAQEEKYTQIRRAQ